MENNIDTKEKNNLIKLFIYIPTYNRPESLRKCLKTLFPQANKYSDRVRIMVNDNNSDNCVNDNLLSEFSYKSFSLRKNSYNIGGNANMNLGFIFANQDEFLWILGDDDYLCDTALDTIFSCDSNNDLLLMTNTAIKSEVNYSIQKSYEEWKSFWVSANVFNMKTYKKYIGSVFYYHNTSYPHVAIQWVSAISQNIKMVLLPLSQTLERTVSKENNSDENYSLAWTGAFGLSAIINQNDGNRFLIFWLKNYGINLFLYKKSEPDNYDKTVSFILKRPLKVIYFYFKAKMQFHAFQIGLIIKNNFKNKNGEVPFIKKRLLLKIQKFVLKENVVFKIKKEKD
jgi:glycosyltransferase involved in cell wall biosynthesis